jgi:hypothetical protein
MGEAMKPRWHRYDPLIEQSGGQLERVWKTNRLLGVTAILLALFIALSCAGGPYVDRGDPFVVELRVHDTSCASGDVAWEVWTVQWRPSDRLIATLPWSMTIDVFFDAEVKIAAQRQCDDGGTITVEIRVNDQVRMRRTGQGPFAETGASTWVD